MLVVKAKAYLVMLERCLPSRGRPVYPTRKFPAVAEQFTLQASSQLCCVFGHATNRFFESHTLFTSIIKASEVVKNVSELVKKAMYSEL